MLGDFVKRQREIASQRALLLAERPSAGALMPALRERAPAFCIKETISITGRRGRRKGFPSHATSPEVGFNIVVVLSIKGVNLPSSHTLPHPHTASPCLITKQAFVGSRLSFATERCQTSAWLVGFVMCPTLRSPTCTVRTSPSSALRLASRIWELGA